MIPQLTFDPHVFDVNNVVAVHRHQDHRSALDNDCQYVIKHRILGLFLACSPLNDRESHLTQNIEEARRWSAEYLNRTAWDWSLENEAIALP